MNICFENYQLLFIVFQVLNFDPVTEILKIRCHIYILMKIFLKIFQNSQETFVLEETPVNFAKFFRTPFLQNNSGQLLLKVDIAITKHEIQIVFVVESWMQCLLLQLKSQRVREESHYPAFMGNSPTISHICQSYLPDR